MEFINIGTFFYGDSEDSLRIKLNSGYEKACIKLELFSHCLLFFKEKNCINNVICEIITINEKTGELKLKLMVTREVKGELVDIKPYFPCEDTINEALEIDQAATNDKADNKVISFKGKSIGNFVLTEGHQRIHIYDKELFVKLESLNEGAFVKVLWWFHGFDKPSFRKNRMCQPPYEHAPKTGIFATRSPVRPNPLALSTLKITQVNVDYGYIDVLGFDGFEKSEILQIMIYQPENDRVLKATVPSWLAHWTEYKSFDKPREINMNEFSNVSFEDIKNSGQKIERYDEIEKEGTKFQDEPTHHEITVKNARIHNLKNVSVTIPKEKITMITGVSGSGKSSLAFDTIYTESQKQFMDLMSVGPSYENEFNDTMVDKITGLQPSIAIEQRSLGLNPRSTVGTITKIGDYMKQLFALLGTRLCGNCHEEVGESNVCHACGKILFDLVPQVFSHNHPDYMCPTCKGLGLEIRIDESLIVEHPEKSILDSASSFWGDLRKHRKKPNANWMRGEVLALADDMNVNLELPFNQLPEAFCKQLFYGSEGREVSLHYKNSKGRSGTITRPVEGVIHTLNRLIKDSQSDKSMENASKYMTKTRCSRCQGERLLEEGRLVHIYGFRFPQIMNMSIDDLHQWCHYIYGQMTTIERDRSKAVLAKILYRLAKVKRVGLSYLTLDRSVPSLSGGEAQRIKLATQFGSGLTNILYIMDEPSKGLHPKDYRFLFETLSELKKNGNTVVLVEHKKSFMSISDYHIKIGPKAGRYGGEIVDVHQVIHSDNTYLEPDWNYKVKDHCLSIHNQYLEIVKASTNNLKNVNAMIPIGKITAITGVSGSGKSSLISKTLYPALLEALGQKVEERPRLEQLKGVENIKEVHYVSQKSIGKNSRSNPGTYTGVFDLIRAYFAKSEDAKKVKMSKEHFSFNSKKGQCPSCKGLGEVAIDMHYMDNVYTTCQSCHGKRYKDEVLQIKPEGYSIAEILNMDIGECLEVFKNEAPITSILGMVDKIGLSYIKLGQSAATLSGGEAQRIKLAKELSQAKLDNVLYILDEPTTGLHDDDVSKLVNVLDELNQKGATIIIIEHNDSLIKACDWLIELGPEGGALGGEITKMGNLITI